MKRFHCVLVLLFFCCFSVPRAQAQESHELSGEAFDLGTNVLSLGVGIGGTFGSYSTTRQSPALSVAYERSMWELGDGYLGLGGYLGYKSYAYQGAVSFTSYEQRWSYTIIGASLAYHYDLFDNNRLDPYAGVLLALRMLKYTDNYPYAFDYLRPTFKSSAMTFSLYIGTRYYITPSIGAFAQIGYGISYFTLGANLKF